MSPRELQDRLVNLAGCARSVDVRIYEEKSLVEVVRELTPRVDEILTGGLELLEAVSGGCEVESAPAALRDLPRLGGAFYRAVDSLMAAEANGQLSDLAFMGCFELRAKQEQLHAAVSRAAEAEDPSPADDARADGARSDDVRVGGAERLFAELISHSSSTLRTIAKVTTAMENTLAEHAGFEPRLDFVTEMRAAHGLRYGYGKLCAAVLGDAPPAEAEIRERLLSAGTAIARFIGRDAYWHLRYDDRLELRRLQRRILDWMSEAGDARAGVRLWQDVAGFARLMSDVNRRSEIVENQPTAGAAHAEPSDSTPSSLTAA